MPKENTGANARRHIDPAQLADIAKAITALGGPADGEEGGAEDGAVHVHVHTHDGASRKPTEDGASTTDSDKRLTVLEEGQAALGATLTELAANVKTLAGEAIAQRRATADAALDDAGDSKALETGYKDLHAKCEILVPGFKMATFDAAATRSFTVDRMCQQRTRALELLGATTEGSKFLGSVAGDPDLDISGMDCKATALLFNAAAAAKASMNNRAATGDSGRMAAAAADALAPKKVTISSINDANKKFWDAQKANAASR